MPKNLQNDKFTWQRRNIKLHEAICRCFADTRGNATFQDSHGVLASGFSPVVINLVLDEKGVEDTEVTEGTKSITVLGKPGNIPKF